MLFYKRVKKWFIYCSDKNACAMCFVRSCLSSFRVHCWLVQRAVRLYTSTRNPDKASLWCKAIVRESCGGSLYTHRALSLLQPVMMVLSGFGICLTRFVKCYFNNGMIQMSLSIWAQPVAISSDWLVLEEYAWECWALLLVISKIGRASWGPSTNLYEEAAAEMLHPYLVFSIIQAKQLGVPFWVSQRFDIISVD